MSILTTYRPLIDINPAKASLLDQSGNGYNAVSNGTGSWGNFEKKKAIQITGTNKLTVTTSATLDAMGDFTILVFGDFTKGIVPGRNSHLINKSASWEFYCAGQYLDLYRGVTSSGVSSSVLGARMVGVTAISGSKPKYYKDGAYLSTATTATSHITNTNNLFIGNYGATASSAYNFPSWITRVLVFDQILTDQVISQIYDEVEAENSAGDPKTINFKGFMPPIDTNCMLAYDMETKTGDGKMADLSGNNRVGTITRAVKARMASGFPAYAHSNGTLIQTASSVNIGTTHTVEWIADGNTANAMMLSYNSSNFIAYYLPGQNGIMYRANGVDVTWTIPALDGKEHHFVLDRSGTTVILYMDGISLGTQTLASNEVQTFRSTGNNPYYWTGRIGYVQVYSDSKGATWAADRYKRYAKKLVYDSQSEYWTPTLANVTAGRIGNTDFTVSTGTWKVSEDANKQKWIENVISGIAYKSFDKAYGTWVWKLNKVDTTIPYFFMVSDTIVSGAGGGSANSYNLGISSFENVALAKIVAGSVTNLSVSPVSYIAASTDYYYAVSRSIAGVFTIYIKGGAYTNWTLVSVSGGVGNNPTTDTTTTTSRYMLLDLDAGDKISDIRHYQGVLDLSTLPN